jgi:hypothetical protein
MASPLALLSRPEIAEVKQTRLRILRKSQRLCAGVQIQLNLGHALAVGEMGSSKIGSNATQRNGIHWNGTVWNSTEHTAPVS